MPSQKIKYIFTIICLSCAFNGFSQRADVQDIEPHSVIISNYVFEEEVRYFVALMDEGNEVLPFSGTAPIKLNGEATALEFENGKALVAEPISGLNSISLPQKAGSIKLYYLQPDKLNKPQRHIPLWLSAVPPLLAILLALVLKEVLVSLFAGVWAGAFIIHGLSPMAIITGLFRSIDTYILSAVADSAHLSVIIFSMLIGGMVAVISRNGGMAGIVDKLSAFAKTARSAQLITWLMGIAIFFDDYANTLVVGNTMRPVTDRFKVSREKLSYIVDSTAAPVAATALVTTWIGAELGFIQDAINTIAQNPGIRNLQESAYSIFLHSLKYSLYPLFTLAFIFMLIWMKKDFGPMLKAEKKARQQTEQQQSHAATGSEEEEMSPKEGIKHRWYNAVIPLVVMIVGILAALYYTGRTSLLDSGVTQMNLQGIIGASDSYLALLWGSMLGVITALLLSVGTRTLSLKESMNSLMAGFKTMLTAIFILVLAWSLANTTEVLHTADFFISIVPDNLSAYWLPVITFVLAAIISFAIGSSWTTMAILYPLSLSIAWLHCQQTGVPADASMLIFFNVTSCVLAGSVLGDHCSPISDTTILSSLASQCDHISHVRTQLPYALTVGGVSIFCGGVLFALRVPWWLAIVIGLALLFGIVWRFGKTSEKSALN